MIDDFLKLRNSGGGNGNGQQQAATQPAAEPQAATVPAPDNGASDGGDGIMDTLLSEGDAAAAATATTDSDISPLDGVADWIEQELTAHAQRRETATGGDGGGAPLSPTAEPLTPTTAPAGSTATTATISGKSDPLAGAGIEIGIDIFVEILEAVTSSVAAWYAGDDQTAFDFDKKLKAKYVKVATLYAKDKQIEVSVDFLFWAFTIILVGQVGYRAHRRKGEILRAQNFRREMIRRQSVEKPRGGQYSLFSEKETTQEKTIKIDSDNSITIPEGERMRKKYDIDPSGFYVHDQSGVYLKKAERRQKPSPEIRAFFDEFYSVHLAHPNNKQVKQFIKTI